MNEFNPNCGKCGMLNSRGFCSLTACRYPSNAIVVQPTAIRNMMVNPQIQKPTTHFDWIKSLSVEKLANVLTDDWCEILCGSPSICDGQCEMKMLSWLKTPLNKEGG